MKSKDFKSNISNLGLPLLVVIAAAALRLLPHPANVAPIAAMALFGGAYIKNKKAALVLPLLAMFFSDIFLGFSQSTPYVYLCFTFSGLLGIWLSRRKTIGNVIVVSLASSLVFFLVTNFGYWLSTSLYPKTIAGQIEAYYFALPFLRNTLLGDLLYTGIFFGGYEAVKSVMFLVHDKNLYKNRG
jgi:hypothetical protein